MKLNAEYAFIRHGEHPTKSNQGIECIGGLTQRGIDEACQIGRSLNFISTNPARALTVTNRRSVTTAALALTPSLGYAEVGSVVDMYIGSGRIAVDGYLDYKRAPADFVEELNDAFFSSRGLEFLILSSRESKWCDNPSISTYDDMARTMARRLNLIHEAYEPQIICAREFFYPSLRAKLIERQLGSIARDDYVEWYGEEVEWSSDARTQIQIVQIAEAGGENRVLIKDRYGTSEYSMSILRGIANN